jgi:hypothetical protein
VDRLNVKNLLELAVKSADNLILTAKKLEKDDITANKANALVNSYRSAGNLYLGIVQAVDGSRVLVRNVETNELSQDDKKRLDRICELLSDKPSKRGKRKKQED